MNVPRIEIDYPSIALLGRFKPEAVQPPWLRDHGLIRPEEAEPFKGFLDHEDSCFIASWLQLLVCRNLFWATTWDPVSARPLRDVVLAIFKRLPDTPVHWFAVSRHFHVTLPRAGGPCGLGAAPSASKAWDRRVDALRRRAVFVHIRDKKRRGVFRDIVLEASKKVEQGIHFTVSQSYRTRGRRATRKLMHVLDTEWDCILDVTWLLGKCMVECLMALERLESAGDGWAEEDAAIGPQWEPWAKSWEPEMFEPWEGAQAIEGEVAVEEPEPLIREVVEEVHAFDEFVPASRRAEVLQEWEGTVGTVREEDGEFTATVRDLTDPAKPEEEMTLRIRDVPAADHALLAPGGIFYWTVGHEEEKGEVVSFSHLRFRRLPPATARRVRVRRRRRKGWKESGESRDSRTTDPGDADDSTAKPD